MKRKIITLLATLMTTVCALSACFGGGGDSSKKDSSSGNNQPIEQIPLDVNHGIADQSYLYGMCYIQELRTYWGSPFEMKDLETEIQLVSNLGAKTVRHWMHSTALMTNKNTMNEEACELMHKELEETGKHGIIDIGMSHHNFNEGASSIGKIRRSLIVGSEYIRWLDDYYTTWYNLVKEFPEVEYWEIDNELNNPDFMFNAHDRTFFSSTEMAAIATDMLYYGTRAIHDANPNAKSVMGGLTEPMGLGNSDLANSKPSNAWFMQAIYDNIFSGEFGYFYSTETNETASLDPDDYFDIASWHPYYWDSIFDADFFVEKNNEVYQVILDNEGKHKKVFITEVGVTTWGRGEQNAADFIEGMYTAIAERMPYVETLNLFHMFDTAVSGWAGAEGDNGYARWGMFYDPDPTREYLMIDETLPFRHTDVKCQNGAAKPIAYKYQELAGGFGALDLLVDYYKVNKS